MALQGVGSVTSKTNPLTRKTEPLLTEEDEAFLHRIASDGEQNPVDIHGVPIHGKDAQYALMDGAQDIPLPMSPSGQISGDHEQPQEPQWRESSASPQTEQNERSEGKIVDKNEKKKKKSRPWSWISHYRHSEAKKLEEEEATAGGDSEVSTKATTEHGEVLSNNELQKEQEDMAALLEKLNLAAVNNRAFSIGDETQELLHKFKLIFKDLVTGVPTAYHDLESLLTNGDNQLQNAFGHLPSFLQKLVQKLPEQLTEHLGPELLTAAASKPSKSGLSVENAGKAAAAVAAKKMGFKTLSLKELVAKPTALASLLRSIIGFLRTRFPAVLGVNVLWSLALFILLFVLWYCHKRGREVRLENERLVTEAEIEKMNKELHRHIRPTETLSTTAPREASIEEVQRGVEEVQRARETSKEEKPVTDVTTSHPNPPTPGPSKKHPDIQPYEGT